MEPAMKSLHANPEKKQAYEVQQCYEKSVVNCHSLSLYACQSGLLLTTQTSCLSHKNFHEEKSSTFSVDPTRQSDSDSNDSR
jgi:hypothetical protein